MSHSATLDVQRRIANAIARSGSHEFYAALLDLTRSYTGFRLASLVRYSRIGIPELVYPGDFSPALSGKYLDFFYSFDPFHIYWQQGGPAVWVSLTNVAQPDFWSTSYANEFLIPFGISDEVCFFMPPLERVEDYLELVTAIEATARELDCPVLLEGYEPPGDPRI